VINGVKTALHPIPSGIMRPALHGNGVAVAAKPLEEIEGLRRPVEAVAPPRISEPAR
jgi:adenylosuccinate synthase